MVRERRCRGTLAVVFAALALAALTACSSPIGPNPIPGAPSLTCPSDVSATASSAAGMTVTYQVPTAYGGDAPVTVNCLPPSGSRFVVGSTPVSCTATDKSFHSTTCSFAVRVSLPPKLRVTRFMAFGDSITEGKAGPAPAFDFPGSYPSRLQDMLNARYTAQTIVVTRRGYGGYTTLQLLAASVLSQALAEDRPEVVLLVAGANDLSGGNAAAVAPALSNLRQIVDACKRAGALVYLGTLTPQREGAFRAAGYPLLSEYNRGVTLIASQTGSTLVDLFTALSPNLALYVDWDGLHLTQDGYQKVADTFYERISATLETTF